MDDSEAAVGHVFLSYVREDTAAADRLQANLEAAGIRVWRDTKDLWPGGDWKMKIRQAISADALVFLACFSSQSIARTKSYQNEELVLAIEEFRQRRPDEPWLIPIRLDDCQVPDREIGGGRMLSSLQRVDLFGDNGGNGVARLVATVVRLLGRSESTTRLPLSTSLAEQVKAMLPLPERDIALEDLVMAEADRCAESLCDPERFPTSSPALRADGERFLVDQAHLYLETMLPLAELLVTGCAFGGARHNRLWRRAIETVGNTVNREPSGHAVLLELRHLSLLPVLYAAGLGAIARDNWPALVAVTTQARVRDSNGAKVSAVSHGYVWLPFRSAEIAASVLAIEVTTGEPLEEEQIKALRRGTRGKRLTPMSDVLHHLLRPLLRPLIRDDRDFDDVFDELEVLMGIIAEASAAKAKANGTYERGGWPGASTWRRRYDTGFEQRVWADRRDQLLAVGAFDGAADAADAAAGPFLQRAVQVRRHQS